MVPFDTSSYAERAVAKSFWIMYGRLLEEDGIKRSQSKFGMFDIYKLDDIFASKWIDGPKRNEEDFKDYAELTGS